jgi:hypothetical protein
MDAARAILYQPDRERPRSGAMNISMNIECTPEEARRLMGLPDMAPIHEIYLDKMRQTMTEGFTPDMMETMIRAWTPMGEAGMSAWKKLLENMTLTASKG